MSTPNKTRRPAPPPRLYTLTPQGRAELHRQDGQPRAQVFYTLTPEAQAVLRGEAPNGR